MNQQTQYESFELSHKPYWKLLLQTILLIILVSISYVVSGDILYSLSSGLIGIAILIVAFLISKWLKIKLFRFNKLSQRQLIYIVVGVIVCQLIYFVLSQPISITENQQELNDMLKGKPFILQLSVVGIIGPLCEEIIFRGLLIKGIFRGIPVIGGVISALLFGFAHFPTNIWEWCIYTAYGVVFVTGYMKTKRLEVPILMHIFHNSLYLLIHPI